MQLAPSFPSALFFEGLHLLLGLSFAALLFGYHTRIASVAATGLMLLAFGFSYSLGKVNHNMLFVLLPSLMACSNWGAAYSFDAQAHRTSRDIASWPIMLVVLMTGFAMFTAGLPKILGGWLDPSTQAAQGRFVRAFFVQGRQDLLAPLAIQVDAPMLWELFDIATVCLEVGFLFAILSPIATRLFVVGAVAFHTGVMLTMNIAFMVNLIVYAVVLPWPTIAQQCSGWGAFVRPIRSAWNRWGVLLGTTGLFYWVGSPLLYLNGHAPFTSDLTLSEVIAMGLAWIVILGVFLLPSTRPTRRTISDESRRLLEALSATLGSKCTRRHAEKDGAMPQDTAS